MESRLSPASKRNRGGEEFFGGLRKKIVRAFRRGSRVDLIHILRLPPEVLGNIWSHLSVADVLVFSCCSRDCFETVGGFLGHAASVLLVHKRLNDAWLIALVCKLSRIKMLSIVCGRNTGPRGFEFSERPSLTFEGVEKMLSILPPRALVDINGGNCYLGDVENLSRMFSRRPSLLRRLSNLHLRPGLPKEIVLRLLYYCSNLRALSLEQCAVDASATDVRVDFPHLQYLTIREVSFAYSRSLSALLSSCGDSLITFEMTNCIGFWPEELDSLTNQGGLQLLTLRQRCTLSETFINDIKCDQLRILCLDSVLPDEGIGHIIAHSPQLQVLETFNISDEVFFKLGSARVVNSHLHRLTLQNSFELPLFTNTGLDCVTAAFPKMERLSLRSFVEISTLPNYDHLRQLTELKVEDVSLSMAEIEKIIEGCKQLVKLLCKSLRANDGASAKLRIGSSSLAKAIFKNCHIEHIDVIDSPNLTQLSLSRLRSTEINFGIFGRCYLKLLELTRLDGASVDGILSSLVKSAGLLSKWLKVRCSDCGPTLRTIQEALPKFRGNFLFVARPFSCKLNSTLKSILSNLGNLSEKGMPYNENTAKRVTHSFDYYIQDDIYMKGNFPIEPLTCQSPRQIRYPLYSQCLTVVTNFSKDNFIS